MAKQSLIGHPKTADLADRLDCDISDAVGLLECLFHFTGNYAANGLIGRWSDRAIVDGMKTRRPIQTVIQALAASGWILRAEEEAEKLEIHCPSDHDRWYVHNWHVHAQTWVRDKLIEDGETFFFGHAAERTRGRQPKNLPPQKTPEKTENKSVESDSQIENKSFTNDLETNNKSETNPNQRVISSRASLPSASLSSAKRESSNYSEVVRAETGIRGPGSSNGSALIKPCGSNPEPVPRVRSVPKEDPESRRRLMREQHAQIKTGGGS